MRVTVTTVVLPLKIYCKKNAKEICQDLVTEMIITMLFIVTLN